MSTASAVTRSVAKVFSSAVTRRGSSPSTQSGALPSSLTTTHDPALNTTTSSSDLSPSAWVMLTILISERFPQLPVAASSRWASPLRRVVVLMSIGVFLTTPGAH